MTSAPEPSQGGVRFGQPAAAARRVPSFGRSGSFAGVVLVVGLLGAMVWAGADRHVSIAAHPTIFGGSLVLEDQRPLTVIDVATAKVTVRLQGIDAEVGAPSYGEIEAVPLSSGTMLVDRKTGTFNLLGRNDYVVDSAGPGVGLGSLPGSTGADALAEGTGAYILRHAPLSTVSLVDETTVLAGQRLETQGSRGVASAVLPKGFADLGGTVSDQPGSAAVQPGTEDLWVLVGRGSGCDLVRLRPLANAKQGLQADRRASFSFPCTRAAVEASVDAVAVATPGHMSLFTRSAPLAGRSLPVASTASATGFLPVTGATDRLWFLIHSDTGWSVAGVDRSGRTTGPAALSKLGVNARPSTPGQSAGVLYTVDQAAPGQPDLWRILPATGAMVQVRGQPQYPAQGPTEKASFDGAQVIVDGPRVVFNNPGSLLAVVVFTDGTHPPVVVDKSTAVTLSATGPADLGVAPPLSGSSSTPTTVAGQGAVPAIQPVSKQVTCATTTQKPYAPQISSISASSSTALVSWSYELLDQTDCEPDSWSVRVTALSGSHQPDQPVQVVNGQNQLLFGGLRPATTYQVVVTAYINLQSTPSAAGTFTTAARGPDAPTSVTTAADGKGDWVISWTPCASASCVVPADEWNVIGTACGASYIGQPPTVQVPGSQTSLTVNADSLGLLGDSLSFSVQGSLASGLPGNPTSDQACTEGWRPPDRNFITVAGSGQQAGQTITATLRVSTSEPAVEAFGSNSTEFVYQVGGSTVGPTSAASVTVTGLAAGQMYTPSVMVYPTSHPDATVTVTGQPFSKNLAWPADLSLNVRPTVEQSNPNVGSLQLSFANVPPGSLTASGNITCGSTQSPQFSGPLASGILTVTMDLVQLGGSCGITATLSDQDATVYGRPSDPITSTFMIGTQPEYKFTASVPEGCQQPLCNEVVVDKNGSELLDRGGNWTIVTKSQNALGGTPLDPCGRTVTLTTPPVFPDPVDVSALCDERQVDVVVSWMYLGVTTRDDLGTPSGALPPPSTTTTSTTIPTTTTVQRGSAATGASASRFGATGAAGALVVAWFVGLVAARGRRTGKR